ncbi:MAG: M20 family metallopeptidase [Candidatus Latescibacter sp.]|nr:M20 family metallopeptidase [Candidatus Latescibacter sp.]
MHDRISQLADSVLEKMISIRHDLHSHPEIKLQETRTASTIESFLDRAGIKHRRCAGTGVIGVIGKGSGHIVALRADIDALPIPDHTNLPWSSANTNVAHACGHDGHTAILLGTAWVLKQMEAELTGTILCLWQPAEEGGAGADKMIKDGALENPAPEAIFAVHGWPSLSVGKAGYRFGPALASTDDFVITVKGKGTHGAMPHAGIDPIVTAARIVEGIQLIRSRMINPLAPLVITVGSIHGGNAVNVIPDEVLLSGTIRTLDPETRRQIPPLMERMIVETARASGAEAEFALTAGYPPVINEERSTAFARDALLDILGADNVVEIKDPVMGGEDFAYYLEKIPGSFLRIGVGDRPPLHNSSYDFNDEAIPFGIRIMAGIAVKFLEKGLPFSP